MKFILFLAIVGLVSCQFSCFYMDRLPCVENGCFWCKAYGACMKADVGICDCHLVTTIGDCEKRTGCQWCSQINQCKFKDGENCQCGNGVWEVDFNEACDGTPNCNSLCKCDQFYEPVGGICTPICGDGVMVGSENCEIFDNAPGQQCSETTCQCAAGYEPNATHPGYCASKCGNGRIDDNEECDYDDTNKLCESCKCKAPSIANADHVCVPIIKCGDKTVNGDEECDSTDHCDTTCHCEENYISAEGVCVDKVVVELCDFNHEKPVPGHRHLHHNHGLCGVTLYNTKSNGKFHIFLYGADLSQVVQSSIKVQVAGFTNQVYSVKSNVDVLNQRLITFFEKSAMTLILGLKNYEGKVVDLVFSGRFKGSAQEWSVKGQIEIVK